MSIEVSSRGVQSLFICITLCLTTHFQCSHMRRRWLLLTYRWSVLWHVFRFNLWIMVDIMPLTIALHSLHLFFIMPTLLTLCFFVLNDLDLYLIQVFLPSIVPSDYSQLWLFSRTNKLPVWFAVLCLVLYFKTAHGRSLWYICQYSRLPFSAHWAIA